MPQTAAYVFVYHQMLVLIAGAVCLFGTWVGMRHFARARTTEATNALRLAVHGIRRHWCRHFGPRPSSRSLHSIQC